MQGKVELEKEIQRIDGRGYKAYKDLKGLYDFGSFQLAIDYVQGDPFASPSRLRVIVPMKVAKFPGETFNTPYKKIAFKDYLTRYFHKVLQREYRGVGGTGKSGMLTIDAPGQEILDRTSVYVDHEKVEARLEAGLPAKGRRILGKGCKIIFFDVLPKIVEKALLYDKIPEDELLSHIQLAEDQHALRQALEKENLIAFVANGSILPRESGISQKPLGKNAVPFISPESMEMTFRLPHKGEITGMGIKKGITLIVGGGYHGKSTLLQALESGVYEHIRGDGREFVLADPMAMKIRAEDGRRVEKVNISPFINNLPQGTDTVAFSTENASGSTSQAANIIEALEGGATTLLIDEDTSATNFMIRDQRMKELVHKEKEPISPFIDKVGSLHREKGVSTILVIGGSGEYFDVADRVIMMDEYRPKDVTEEAKAIAERDPDSSRGEEHAAFGDITPRRVLKTSFPRDRKGIKIKTKGVKILLYNRLAIELYGIEQLMDYSQTNAIGEIIRILAQGRYDEKQTISEILDDIHQLISTEGLEKIASFQGHPGNLARPRKLDVLAALNRYRNLKTLPSSKR